MDHWRFFYGIIRACIVAFAVILTGCATTSPVAVRGPELTRLAENRAATFRIDVIRDGSAAGHGTGTVISSEGHILTAYHVVDDEKSRLQIVLDEPGSASPKSYVAKVIAFDKDDDLAVIKIDRRFGNPAVLEDARNLHAGDRVYNVGYPYAFGVMIGRGYVAKTHYTFKRTNKAGFADALLLDIPDGPGTSGSGVFAESSGRLVGVMRLMFWVSSGNAPPMVVRVATSADHVARFLDKNRIPYARPGQG